MVFETDAGRSKRLRPLGLGAIRKSVPILALVTVVLGGLYGGFLNPTEAGAAGAAGALVIALMRRSLDRRSFWTLLVETGQITVSVLFLILAATLFSRMLALSGVPRELAEFFLEGRSAPWGFLILYLLLIIALGCIIDSISIMLILLPIVLPVAEAGGLRPHLVRRADRGGGGRSAFSRRPSACRSTRSSPRSTTPTSRSATSSAAPCPSSGPCW
jgi:C4-dicarboxylate transporter, DctM subunit